MTDMQGLSQNLGDFTKRTIQTLSGSKPFQNSLHIGHHKKKKKDLLTINLLLINSTMKCYS